MRAPRWLPGSAALLAIAALPLAAERLRAPVERCEMDGVALAPSFRVRVVGQGGEAHAFCAVTCAQAWVERRRLVPREILVTAGGREIDADAAWFVRTAANRSDGAPDGLRVFAGRDDALRHAAAYGGKVLDGSNRPFGGGGEGRATAGR